MIILYFSKIISVFPHYWTQLVRQIGENDKDIRQVKAVLTVLGFNTKSSLATLTTEAKVLKLEKVFIKLRQNPTKFHDTCEKYPELRELDSFSPGLVTIVQNLACQIKQMNIKADMDDEFSASVKVLKLAQNVCIDLQFFSLFFWEFNVSYSYRFAKI